MPHHANDRDVVQGRRLWDLPAELPGHPGDVDRRRRVPDLSDGLQPHADVRARLGAVRRHFHLLLGRGGAGVASWSGSGGTRRASPRPQGGWVRRRRGLVKPGAIAEGDPRVLPGRVRQLARFAGESKSRVGSASSWRSTARRRGSTRSRRPGGSRLPRYILYLLPVIGFIGTVEGDLQGPDEHQPGPADGQEPRRVHEQPDERDLGAAGGLRQHACWPCSSAPALMLVQTLVYKRSEDLLGPGRPLGGRDGSCPGSARAQEHPLAAGVAEALAPHLEAMRRDLMAAPGADQPRLAGPRRPDGRGGSARTSRGSPARSTSCPWRWPACTRGAQAINRAGQDLARPRHARRRRRPARGVGILCGRIEVAMTTNVEPTLRSRSRTSSRGNRPRHQGDRGALAVLGLLLRALQPRQPGATGEDPAQPQGRPSTCSTSAWSRATPSTGASSSVPSAPTPSSRRRRMQREESIHRFGAFCLR